MLIGFWHLRTLCTATHLTSSCEIRSKRCLLLSLVFRFPITDTFLKEWNLRINQIRWAKPLSHRSIWRLLMLHRWNIPFLKRWEWRCRRHCHLFYHCHHFGFLMTSCCYLRKVRLIHCSLTRWQRTFCLLLEYFDFWTKLLIVEGE